MDGFLGALVLILIAVVVKQAMTNLSLKKETKKLGGILEDTLEDYNQALDDHQKSENQLHIVEAKLDEVKSHALTPDNAVTKETHLKEVSAIETKLEETCNELKEVTSKYEEARGKAISERVRLGQVGENFASFHDQFPYNRKNVRAMFQPIDLIYFGEDEIVFIDVKTGNSKLSSKQRKIRDNINNGKVRFEIHRIDDTGYNIKKG